MNSVDRASAPAKPVASDPATLLAYKTGVPRDKVEQILAIYEKNAKSGDKGSDIYKIALVAGEQTGLPTAQVGSVIMGYKGMSLAATTKAPEQAKKDTSKS